MYITYYLSTIFDIPKQLYTGLKFTYKITKNLIFKLVNNISYLLYHDTIYWINCPTTTNNIE